MRHPRFNHVALSVPEALLDDQGRADIVAFYQEVMGWEEMPTMTEPGRRLVLQAHRYDQFVFLVSDEHPMTCPRMDHFGLSVDTLEDLVSCHERARAYGEHDDRVDLIAPSVEDFGFLKLHSFYVGYLLPLMVEVQHWDWIEVATAPPKVPQG